MKNNSYIAIVLVGIAGILINLISDDVAIADFATFLTVGILILITGVTILGANDES